MSILFSRSFRSFLHLSLIVVSVNLVRAEADIDAGSFPVPNSYRLAPFDLVNIAVFGEPDFGISQRVGATGYVTMPLLGAVSIGGLTVEEAQGRIETALIEEEFLRRPQVFVTIQGFSPRRITILGEIGSPSSIELPPGVNFFDIETVIAMSGGFTDLARRNAVRVTRRSNAEGRERVLTVDVDAVMSTERDGFAAKRFHVLAGDILFVPRRFF